MTGLSIRLCISRTLSLPERNYSVSKLECLGVPWSIKKLQTYVEADRFTVITDHSALLRLKNLKDPSGRLARWALQMQQWDFQIKHRKGTPHSVPDALSRIYEEDGELILVDRFSEDVIKKDEGYMKMMENVRKTPKKYRSWKIKDARLCRYHYSALLDPVLDKEENWKLAVPEELRERVTCDVHSSPSMGHFGIEKTYDRVAREDYWRGFYYYVVRYIKHCKLVRSTKFSSRVSKG